MTDDRYRCPCGYTHPVARSQSTLRGVGMGNPRRANGHRRDQVRARVLREEDDCWLCGKPVDKTLPPFLHGSPEVDEVLPVSLGGDPLDRRNCRLSHRICNVRRGNGTKRGKPIVSVKRVRSW